ncbi:hypothetical protein [endosymbiont 'TC1' of Trimyema compressum]|nr:hypothetical protein [endosymbiont 'TC1' of Trimyema compressum]
MEVEAFLVSQSIEVVDGYTEKEVQSIHALEKAVAIEKEKRIFRLFSIS